MSRANPFADEAGRRDRRGGGAWVGWVMALLVGGAAGAAVYYWRAAEERARQLESSRQTLEEAGAKLTNTLEETKAALAKTQSEVQQGKEQIAALKSKLNDLENEKTAVHQAAKQLENQMRADLESRDVTISKLQGKLTVNIVDRVMFNSGEAVLKRDGEEVLRKIATILSEHPELKIHVIGHTDNVPIRSRFLSNWELSTARALAAVHFLTEQAGVAPERVGALGYGEYRPIADNATAEGRAKNRRIAITLLPEELAGADAPPAGQTNSVTAVPLPPQAPIVSRPTAETNRVPAAVDE